MMKLMVAFPQFCESAPPPYSSINNPGGTDWIDLAADRDTCRSDVIEA